MNIHEYIFYSTLIFENYATHILFKIFMNIHEYLEYLEYFFDTLDSDVLMKWRVVGTA
jgi:hypothetical protein